MPWRNGGGVTWEVLADPTDGPFDYRVSIAEVAADGPFSRFDGHDRHIVVLNGNGMSLDCGERGAIELLPRAPRAFSGDWDVIGLLHDGPVRDFNLIVARARARGSLAIVSEPSVVRADICILHILSGEGEGDTFVAEGELVVPPGVTAAVASVWRRITEGSA